MFLKVAFPNVTYYPLIIRSEAGKVTGVYIDLLNELAKYANFREVLIKFVTKCLIKALKKGARGDVKSLTLFSKASFIK